MTRWRWPCNDPMTAHESLLRLSFDTFDNSQVPIDGIAQYTECFLVRRTIVCNDGLCDAVEFN